MRTRWPKRRAGVSDPGEGSGCGALGHRPQPEQPWCPSEEPGRSCGSPSVLRSGVGNPGEGPRRGTDTAQSLNNLGVLLKSQGDLSEARPYYDRALTILEKTGVEHPDTAQSLNNLGFLFQSQGDLDGARPYFKRALAIFEARLEPDHPNTKTRAGESGETHGCGRGEISRGFPQG
jgi:tetratricopeptide (TPR) repeat protein